MDPRTLAETARVSIGAGARAGTLARLLAMFPDEAAIAVLDGCGCPIGVVTADQIRALDIVAAGAVGEVMLPLEASRGAAREPRRVIS